MPVRRVERMVTEHVLRFFRQIFLCHSKDVFVVSKREVHDIQPAVRLVDPILPLILGVAAVWIGGKEFRENHLIRIRAPGGEGIADHGPLRFAIEAEHFSKIVKKPARMNHRGWPSLRIASAVCSKCSICVTSVSGSLSSTKVFKYSAISQMLFFPRFRPQYSAFFFRTKSSVWYLWFCR